MPETATTPITDEAIERVTTFLRPMLADYTQSVDGALRAILERAGDHDVAEAGDRRAMAERLSLWFPYCHHCGCSDSDPCEDPDLGACHWYEARLCSSCVLATAEWGP